MVNKFNDFQTTTLNIFRQIKAITERNSSEISIINQIVNFETTLIK